MSRPSMLLLIAWLLAMTATGSALFIGEVMGMVPCVLCWYQRIAMFPLALLLGMAFYSDDRRGAVVHRGATDLRGGDRGDPEAAGDRRAVRGAGQRRHAT